MVNVLETAMSAENEFETLSQSLKSEGMAASPLKAMNNNADTMVPVYHAITNYSHSVPYYMVDTNDGASLLKRTFTNEDVRLNQLDPKWANKRVWYLTEQPTEEKIGDFFCTFSANQPKEKQEEIRTQGFQCDCRKVVTFNTRYDMENHRRLRHPRRHEALARWTQEHQAEEVSKANSINAQALAALTEMLSQQQAGMRSAPKKDLVV